MSENKEFKATVVVKSSKTNSLLVGGDVWYNLSKKQVEEKLEPYLVYEKLNKGDVISGTCYEFKNKKYIVTLKVEEVAVVKEELKKESAKVVEQKSEIIKEDKPENDAEFKCEDCGAKLKDGKYKKCFACNKKNPSKFSGKGKSAVYVDSPEKQDQIARGNAVNALAQILQSVKTPEEFKQKMEMLYASLDKLADYIRKGRE